MRSAVPLAAAALMRLMYSSMDCQPSPGRPKEAEAPSGGSEHSERGGRFIQPSPGRPKEAEAPSGGSERSERGGRFIQPSPGRDAIQGTADPALPVRQCRPFEGARVSA
ncbi:hypothetical protein GCM10025795_15320 [Verticiella sediminum]